jgi:capsular exopolysaccharide synthesis family protein
METDLQSWKNELEMMELQLKNVADEEPALPPGFMQSIANDPKMLSLAKKIESESSRIDYFTKLANGDANNPSVLRLKKRVDELKEERENFRRERVEEYHKAELPHLEKSLKDKIEQTKATIAHLVASLKTQNEAIEKYTKTLGDNGLKGVKLPNFQAIDFRERSKMIVEMINKANLLRTEINAPPRVQDFQRASVPMKKEMKIQLLGTIFAGLFGFGLVGFGVVVHESRIRRAMSLADVQQGMLGPVIGVLPAREEGANALASAEATSEAIEKTRTHLLQQFSNTGGKVIAVTSALSEEGKGFLSSRLAESFARMGSRTLLLDFDLRAPALHQFVHASPERGLCEVMLGQAEFNDAIQVLPNGMMFLPAGKWRDEMRLALTSERIEAFLNWLRPQFDCVVMNTHPLLTVAETFLVCRHADGVLLCVERLESRLPMSARAHEKLAVVAPEAFGVIFQGANAEECCQ